MGKGFKNTQVTENDAVIITLDQIWLNKIVLYLYFLEL